MDWTTTNHTAEDVPVTAMGPGGQNLVGAYENTQIHDAISGALFLGSSSVSASATASAEVQRMPQTGGSAVGGPLLALATLLIGVAGFAFERGVVDKL